MAVRNVIIEVTRTPAMEASVGGPGLRSAAAFAAAEERVAAIPGLSIDQDYAPVLLPQAAPVPKEGAEATSDGEVAEGSAFAAAAVATEFEVDTQFLRGTVDDAALQDISFAAGAVDGVVGIYADPVIEPAITCGGSPAVGTSADVARLLNVPALRASGMTGAGVLVAIVDTGVNIPYLARRLGRTPAFSPARSWVPPLQPGQPPMTPGVMPVDHGTMCAFDVLIAAPSATLLDIAVLASRRPGGSAMDGLLSDAVAAYSHLLRVMRSLGRPGDFRALVVNNSWGMFRQSWDFPVGHPGNYSHNPAHPFNRIVGTLERAGADILFAAGNCGRECPDGRCGPERDAGIYGANGHPAVLSVAGVDIRKARVGYSTRGPGHLDRQKPDISGYTHFRGSGVYPADGGTSAATPVVAGVLAAFRSRFPTGPTRTPAMLRSLVRRTAENVGPPGFDIETGFGIINGLRLARSTMTTSASETDEEDVPVGDDEAAPVPPVQPDASDREFLDALRAYGFGSDASQAMTADTGCAACGDKGSGAMTEEAAMENDDLEFMQALQQFGFDGGAGMGTAGASFGMAEGMAMSGDGDDAELLRALAEYGGPTGVAGFAGAGFEAAAGVDVAAAPGIAELCRVWRTVRPIISRILSFLRAIPFIGSSLARALSTLATILDLVCRGGATGDLCRRWRGGLRTILVRIAGIVGAIPGIGGAASRAIRALISAIDALCR